MQLTWRTAHTAHIYCVHCVRCGECVAHIHHSIEAQRRYAFASLGKVGELEACLHAEKEQKRADLAEEKAAAEASLVSGVLPVNTVVAQIYMMDDFV